MAVNAAAIGPSPVPRADRSPAQGPVIRTSAVGLTLPQTTRRWVSWNSSGASWKLSCSSASRSSSRISRFRSASAVNSR